MRMHISACGGLNMARKVAAMCEFFGVRTAWHGPGNVSPVGHAVNTHIDFAVPNFGCGEGAPFSAQLQEIFPGCPERKNGMTYSNDRPGLGIDIDEKVAAKYAPRRLGPIAVFAAMMARLVDLLAGSVAGSWSPVAEDTKCFATLQVCSWLFALCY